MNTPQTPSKPEGIVAKVKSAGKAIKSVFSEGFSTPELQRVRLDICQLNGGTYCDKCSKWKTDGKSSCTCSGPEFLTGPCPLLRNDNHGLHCTQCGCNQTTRATDIRVKVVAPKVDCPRELWPTEEDLNNG